MDISQAPVGVFDSGVGEISVLRELVKLMPNENYIYYGDSKNAPYGPKTVEEVRRLTVEHIDFLVERGAKAIVVACNTATSAAIDLLREKYPDMAGRRDRTGVKTGGSVKAECQGVSHGDTDDDPGREISSSDAGI